MRLAVEPLECRLTPTSWYWAGATSSWSNPANWSTSPSTYTNAGSLTPANGDTLFFDTTAAVFAGTATAFAPNNDLNLIGLGITINDSSAVGDFDFTGNNVTISNGVGQGINCSVSNGVSAIFDLASVSLSNTDNFVNTTTAPLIFNCPVNLNGNDVQTVGPGNMIFNGVISGTGGFTRSIATTGTVTLANTGNTYTGANSILGGILNVANLDNGGVASSIGQSTNAADRVGFAGAGSLVGTLQYTGATAVTTDRLITISSGGGIIDASGSVAAATVTFGNTGTNLTSGGPARTLTLTGSNTGNNTLASILTGSNLSVAKTGTGTWVLSGANTYTGTTTVSAGTLVYNGTDASTQVNLNGGTFTGSGTVKNFNATGGTVDPGSVGGIATLTFAGGAASTLAGATLRVDLSSSGSGDLLQNNAGTLTLTGASLQVSATSTSVAGQAFTIVNSPGGLSGTFTGLADGSIITGANGKLYQVNYTATTVTLTEVLPATHIGMAAPATAVAGTTFNVTVSALDANDLPTQHYSGTVTLTTTDAAGSVVPVSHTFVPADNGVFTFAVTLRTAGVQTITASDGVFPDVHGTAQVADTGIATQVVFRQQPTQSYVGTIIKPAITALVADQYGNAVVSANVDQIAVSLINNTTGAVLAGTTTMRVVNGVATFGNLSINRAGSYQLLAASGLLPSAVSSSFSILPRTTTALRVSFTGTTTSTTDVAGSAFTVTVTPLTALGTVDTSYRGTVHFTSTDPQAGLPADYTFTGSENGVVASFAGVLLKTAGARGITVTDIQDGVRGAKGITVTPAAVAGFNFGALATTAVVLNKAQIFVLSAIDPFGNVNAAFTGNVALSLSGSGGGTLTPAAHSFVAADKGRFTFALKQTTAETPVVTATSGLLNSTQTVAQLTPSTAATIPGTTASVPGETVPFTFTASVGTLPASSRFTFAINWGDGAVQTVTGSSSVVVSHTFTRLSPVAGFPVKVTVTDAALKTATATPLAWPVVGVTLEPDSLGTMSLFIGGSNAAGSAGNDSIAVTESGGNVSVTGAGSFTPVPTSSVTGRIYIFGQAGNDTITASTSLPTVISGGAGNDTLTGGAGRDLLIGGLGADVIHGGGADDILIGGTTTFDAKLAALDAIMAEWASTDSYATRIGRILGSITGGLNGSTFLNPSTVKSDPFVDTLFGDAAQNWYWYTAAGSTIDLVQDLTAGQVAMALSR